MNNEHATEIREAITGLERALQLATVLQCAQRVRAFTGDEEMIALSIAAGNYAALECGSTKVQEAWKKVVKSAKR
jgi:hypothetical protein